MSEREHTEHDATAAVVLAPPSPLNGVRLPLGAHPGNTGGKKGRAGRKPDEFKAALAEIRDVEGVPVLQDILNGRLTYTLTGVCEHCGEPSSGPPVEAVLKLAPGADARLRAVDMTMRYTVGLEKIIRLEGPVGVQRAFDIIRQRIQALLAPAEAEMLLADIQQTLKGGL